MCETVGVDIRRGQVEEVISTIWQSSQLAGATEQGELDLGEGERSARWGPAVAALIVVIWAGGVLRGFQMSLLILTVLSYMSLVIGLRYPAIGLLGVMVLCILDAPARVYILTGGLLRWNTFNYWLLLMMALYAPFLVRLRDVHSLALMAFVGLLTIEILVSPDVTNGTQNVLGIISVFGMLIYFVRAGGDRRMWFWLSVNGGLVGALGGMVFFMQRISLPTINENAWAAFPLTALIAVIFGFPAAASLKRGQPTLLVLATANLAWIFLSGSRGNLLIGSCCFLVLLVGLSGARQRTIAISCAALIGLVAAAHFGRLQERTIHRITKLFTTEHALAGDYSLGGRTSGRSDLAIGGWYIFKDHPLGVGTGGFPTAWSKLGHHYTLSYGRGEEKAAHSGWVKTLVENGVPGLTLLIVYVFSFAAVALRQRSWVLWRLGMITSVALSAALLSTEFQTKAIWFLAAGATAFLHRHRLEEAMYGRPGVSELSWRPARSPRYVDRGGT